MDDDRRRYEDDVFYMDSRHAAEREIRAQDEARRRRREEWEMEREMVEYYRYLAEQDAREQS